MAPSNKRISSLQEGRMSLILDTYNDIFSSFDPRDYAERSLSDDFLDECKKIVSDKSVDIIELRLMIPESNREVHNEETIKKRLHNYFMAWAHKYEKQYRRDLFRARKLATLGILIGLGVTYILNNPGTTGFLSTLVTVIGEPASWFLIWNGGDKLMTHFWRDKEEYTFAHKLSRAKIQFYEY